MKNKNFIYLLGSLLVISLFISPLGWTQPKPEIKAPVITHSFAVERGPYGYIWKIYIEAESDDGDMFKIASVVDEPGVGRYPTDWIILKPQYQKHLKGYIQWNTHSTSGYLSEWTPITLKVSIIDKAGNESNEVVFPFTFEIGAKDPYQYKLPAPFDQGDIQRLGYIHIDIVPPGGMGGETTAQ
jgi:hypothetical protein